MSDAMLHSKVTNCIESKVATTTTTTVAPTGDNSGKSGSGSGSSTANADGGGQGNTSPAGATLVPTTSVSTFHIFFFPKNL